ncbi:hypothetical protein POTOM_002954 [Populus tomentosa]|uniref:Uncharacterized protein n=1 Tax=Populus tomentosa TaxID=118781 RepID=A0A8X8DKV2_POPTO|nr:hypothetical protein POTOM_002954 [Populus tomentosa]
MSDFNLLPCTKLSFHHVTALLSSFIQLQQPFPHRQIQQHQLPSSLRNPLLKLNLTIDIRASSKEPDQEIKAEGSTNILLHWGDDDNSTSEEDFEGNEDGEREQEQIEETENEASAGDEVAEPKEDHNEFIQAAAVRNRRTPHWIEDYVIGAGLFEEEET